MHDKIDRTAVTSMLDLRNILELVNDGLNDRSFARASVCLTDASVGFSHRMRNEITMRSSELE
jgi:hypothetical protein